MGTTWIRNGWIIDGTNSPGYQGDLFLKDGKIFQIGENLEIFEADETIDATGLYVIPGIIDGHTHTERSIFRNPHSDSKLYQGVTTEVIGQCGQGAYPLPEDFNEREKFAQLWEGALSGSAPGEGPAWGSFSEYARALEEWKPGMNLVPLIPHGTIRALVMGWTDRKANSEEIKQMKEIIRQNLKEGAWGISFGLEYPPGSYSDQEEMIALGEAAAEESVYCAYHLRSEDNYLLEAVEEALNVGRKSGAHIHICHLKADGKPNWGKAKRGLEMIREARKEGIHVTLEAYPYDAFSTTLSLLVGTWVQEGGLSAYMERLDDPKLADQIADEIEKNLDLRGGPSRILVSQTTRPRPEYKGRSIEEIAKEKGIRPGKAVMQILKEEDGGAWGVYFGMDHEEVNYLLQQPDVAIISDGFGLKLPEDGVNFYHPRSFGTFSRVLGPLVRDEKLLTMELAVYKMTGLTADFVGLKDRGRLKAGLAADIAIFDPNEIKDLAGFQESGPYSVGVKYVFINGFLAFNEGEVIGERHGKVLKRI